jgi:hypothetical protein
MIICSANNIDIIQGSLGYGDTTQGVNITDWRISNTQSGVFNIFNSSSITPNISIIDNGTVGIGTVPSISSTSKLEILGNLNITGAYNINNRNVINDTSNYILATSNLLTTRINNTSNYIFITSNLLTTRINNTSNYTLITSNILAARINSTSNVLVSRIDTKQNIINSTIGQLIIGNGNGSTTTNASLTFTNNDTLNAPKFVGDGSLLTNIPPGSKWTLATDTTRIYYNTGNLGIGTTNPINKLHIFDNTTTTTSITIQNNNQVVSTTPSSGGLINAISVTGATAHTTIGTTDRFMIFTANGSFTVPAVGIVCDILMIGGGGAGGASGGGGGGAGACIVAINQSLTTTGVYNVFVGGGDTATTATTGAGGDSSIGLNGGDTLYIAKGGGRGESINNGRNNGGCGGGSGYGAIKTGGIAINTNMVAGSLVDANARSATFAVFGNKGGDRPDTTTGVTGVGGGGIGGAGGNHITGNINAGPGGIGLFQATIGGTVYNFRSHFTNNGNPYNFGVLNSADNQYYIGGGGGGSVQTTNNLNGPNAGGVGGFGGGGNGGITSTIIPATAATGPAINATSATANTGSGGGGAWATSGTAGNGGSGIVIIRYRIPSATIGVPSLNLIRGTTDDSNQDLKLGNYDGNFKIMSAVSGTPDAERLNITSVGNVGIGTSSPANELHIFDSTTSSTSLIIQNNNLMITSNVTQGTTTTQGPGFVDFIVTFNDANVPSVNEPVSGSTTERIMIFKTVNVNHTFTVPTGGLNCDILMIGGGGRGYRGGGGAGACIVTTNQTLPEGTCVVRVGNGAIAIDSNGEDSYIQIGNVDRYRAKGGGSSSNTNNIAGADGGCGGGASYNSDTVTEMGGGRVNTNVVTLTDGTTTTVAAFIRTATYVVMGYAGGANGTGGTAGGGGGIGAVGANKGNGGDGAYQVTLSGATTAINFKNYFANGSASFGVDNGYIGGGGAGYVLPTGYVSGGLGGGSSYNNGNTAAPNTGSGGCKASNGYGASGIVIIRHRIPRISGTLYTHTPTTTTTLSTPTLGTSSIELVRGTQGDSNTDYKIGNYNGDFLVKSSTSNTDTDYLRISSTGAITNPTGTASWNTGSDRRIKENIERASYDKCFESICRLELNRFNYIKGFNTVNKDIRQLGFIAQEVNEIFPKAISSQPYYSDTLNIPDLLSIDVSQINYALYGAVKKLIETNNSYELRLKKLRCLLNVKSSSGSSNVVIIEDTNNI